MSLFKENTQEKKAVVDNEYAGGHPLFNFTPESTVQREDHLDNYVEVSPFQDTEINWRNPFSKKETLEETQEKLERKKNKIKEKLERKKKKDAAKVAAQQEKDVKKKEDAVALRQQQAADALALRQQQSANAPTKIVDALVTAKKLVDTELANKYTIAKELNDGKEIDNDKKKLIRERLRNAIQGAANTSLDGGKLEEKEVEMVYNAYWYLTEDSLN